jgi:hypothetical protein
MMESGTHIDKRIRPEKITHASTLHIIKHSRFQIDLDGTRHILLVGDFIKVDGKSVELEVRRCFGASVLSGLCGEADPR